ncbi:MAG: GH92 family glycosyl hydrolase [Bacteroidota bacterium]
MKTPALLFICLSIALLFSCSDNNNTEISDYTLLVDPFIGTGGHGHTYPGASIPFGMVQLSPDTRLEGWDGCSGYHYSDDTIYGFSHTHLSGTGCSDYGDILFMPVTGNVKVNNSQDGYPSAFSHEKESAGPGFYSVRLDKYDIQCDLTTTRRCGFHKYTYPENSEAKIIIDLEHRDKVLESYIRKVSDTEIEGFRISQAWANRQYVYFVAQFSEPVTNFEIFKNDSLLFDSISAEGKNIKACLLFGNKNNVLVRVGISAVSTEGARKNLQSEIGHWDFEKAKQEAHDAWNKQLGKISVQGGTPEQMSVFYTAMYHSFLSPNLFMDIDGQFRGTDLQVHKAENFENYTVFSLWDTYRATHPLFTIIERERTKDFISTFLAQYQYGGKLPVWELAGNYTGCMIGYHSIPVITDAYFKGITDFDHDLALEAMLSSAEKDHLGLKSYREKGYIPAGEEGESVSKTLEYAYDDWCIAMFAKSLGKDEIYREYIERAQYYKNIFDPSTGFMRAKTNESWFTPFDPREVNFNYTEANSWQYSFYVPQDISTLINLHGGKDGLTARLDELFTTDPATTGREQADITGLIGQYAHGNEPSHHMAYLYSYVNCPWKTQQYVRQIMDNLYSSKPDGLTGNEDCGQMSSWFVLSAMGFYPVTPGSTTYVIGTPLFPEASINLDDGKVFRIKANKLSSGNYYIQSAKLNGKEYKKGYIDHSDIISGGELEFVMGPKPNENWASADDDVPVSIINDELITIVPFLSEGNRTFRKSTTACLSTIDKDAIIYYTNDGSDPDDKSLKYNGPVNIDKNTTLKAIAFSPGKKASKIIEAGFSEMHEDWSVKLLTEYAGQYSAGGNDALIDCLKGGPDFKTGTWQGYEGVNMEVIVDMNKIQGFKSISTGFLQDHNSWIFMPEYVEYFISVDGVTFASIGKIINDISEKEEGGIVKEFTLQHHNKARYIKVVAKNRGVCPAWHRGSGNPCWIFADEITIK